MQDFEFINFSYSLLTKYDLLLYGGIYIP